MCNGYRTIFLLLVLVASSIGTGCDSNNKSVDKMFEPFFPPTPGEVAREAFTVYDADKRRRAVTLLSAAQFGGEETYLRLYRLLIDDPDATVRAACVKALGDHGTTDDALLLIPRLRDETSFVRWEAARALQKIHHEKAVEPLLNAVAKDEDVDVRLASAYALGQYPSVQVFNVLVGALNDTDFGVVESASVALTTLTGHEMGTDATAWITWAEANQGQLFVQRRPYTWHPYERTNPGLIERSKFWKKREVVTPQPAKGAEPSADANPKG